MTSSQMKRFIMKIYMTAAILLLVATANTEAAIIIYSYDSLNRLTAVSANTGNLINYQYDSAGNRLSQKRAAGAPLVVLASPSVGGGVAGGGNFPVGSLHSISAQPASGWALADWSDGVTQLNRLITIPSGGATYTAYFSKTPFLLWQEAHFTADQLADPGISGANADPDGDGITNAQEFAHSLDPETPNADKITVGITHRGNKPIVTRNSILTIRGTTSSLADIVRVEYRLGSKGKFKPAIGTASWHFKIHLTIGTNTITVRAINIKGTISKTTTIKVIRQGISH